MKTGSAEVKCVKIIIQKLLFGLYFLTEGKCHGSGFIFSQHNLIPKTKGK